MTSLHFYLLNNAFDFSLQIEGLFGLSEGKQILKGLLYLLFLERFSTGMGGSCGFCGHVFIVYALYLSLINAALMSAVTDTSEQQPGLTQYADDFLPTFKALAESKTLPLACLCEPEQEDRCSRKTPNQTKDCQSAFPLLLKCTSFMDTVSLFQHVSKSSDVFFSITIVLKICHR